MRGFRLSKLVSIIFSVFVFLTLAPITFAGTDKASGRVVDENGNGLNGIEVQYRQYRPRLPNEPLCADGQSSNCCYRDPEVSAVETKYCKAETPPLNALTKDDPYDGTGPGWYEVGVACNSEYYIYAFPPLGSGYRLLSTNPVQAQGNSLDSKVVLGVNNVNAASDPTDCTTNPGSQPDQIVGNVNINPHPPIHCPTTTPPPGPACNKDCSLGDFTSAACEAGKTAEPTCSCIPSGTGGKCAACPTFNDAVKLADSCPAGGSWSTAVTIDKSKFPAGPIDAAHSADGKAFTGYQVYIFGPSGSISKANSVDGVLKVDSNLTGFVAHLSYPAVPTPLKANIQYKLMVYDGSESCRPIIPLTTIQDTCGTPACGNGCTPGQKDNCSLTQCSACLPNPDPNHGPGTFDYTCQSCPAGTVYNAQTATCEGGACSGGCKTKTPSCPAAGPNQPACVCVPTGQAPDASGNDGTCKPQTPVCNTSCDPTKPTTDCNGVTDKNSSGQTCNLCLPSTTSPTGGACQACPVGQTFKTTKKCEGGAACSGVCDTRNPVCPAGGSSSLPGCVCIPSAPGSTSGTCGPPACDTKCIVGRPDSCQGATKDGVACTTCVPDNPGSTTGTCKPPSCGIACTKATDCTGAKDGCTDCRVDVNGKQVCQPPKACNMPCNPSNKDFCNGLVDPKGEDCSFCKPSGGGNTCQTAPYDCLCGEDVGHPIEVKNLIPGQVATVTGFMAVRNNDKPVPQKSFKFKFIFGIVNSTNLFESGNITPEIFSSTPNEIIYKATWNPQIPANLDSTKIYAIWLDTNSFEGAYHCQEIASRRVSDAGTGRGVVLGEKNWFQQLMDFLFGWALPKNNSGSGSTGGTVPTPKPTDRNLHLKTLQQAKITEQSCKFIYFKFQDN